MVGAPGCAVDLADKVPRNPVEGPAVGYSSAGPITCAGHKDGLRSRIRVREVEEERANVKPLAGEVHTSTLQKPAFLSQCIAVFFIFFVLCMTLGRAAGDAHSLFTCAVIIARRK